MKPAGVLHEGALPGDGHRQEQGIEPRVVESFANVAASGKHESWFVVRDGGQGREGSAPLGRRHASLENDEMASTSLKAVGKVLEMVLALGQYDW